MHYQTFLHPFLGVFAASIKLADAPVMGDWNITVDVSGQLFKQSFLVAEYVLPKFDVEVIVPEYGRLVLGAILLCFGSYIYYITAMNHNIFHKHKILSCLADLQTV